MARNTGTEETQVETRERTSRVSAGGCVGGCMEWAAEAVHLGGAADPLGVVLEDLVHVPETA